MKIIQGDCLEKLKDIENNSIDSIVTDPPYELGFMGKKWDNTGIANNVKLWKECLRVLKPGGYLLSFGGTRTFHRMASAIEDAGFEVRDMIEWVYGSGFPKSLNIGKAVDKIAGEIGRKEKFTEWMRSTGVTAGEINKLTNSFMGSHYLTKKEQPAIPTAEIWSILRPHIKTEIPKWVDELVERIEREREVIGKDKNWGQKGTVPVSGYGEFNITKGTSEWEGWGTALKPAHEPICMARKPLSEKSVAENCLKWGTGGLNIDESRIETKANLNGGTYSKGEQKGMEMKSKYRLTGQFVQPSGRFPANLIHDNSDEVQECFPNESERFFKSIIYQAKSSKSERTAQGKIINNHPTIKPVALMEYLIKMVTRKGGIVLDPFMGSGSTGVAARNNGYNFIGIEKEEEYFKIAQNRINESKSN